MAQQTAVTEASRFGQLQKRISETKLPWIPIVILAVLLVCAALAPQLSPHDPTDKDVINSRIARLRPATTRWAPTSWAGTC